jgi:hypothetical protein
MQLRAGAAGGKSIGCRVPQVPLLGPCDLSLNPTHSRPGVGLNFPLNRLTQFKASLGQVVHLLEVEPELRAFAEELRQAQRPIGRDRSAAMNDVANARGGDANFHRQRVLRNAEREKKLLAQHLARMRRNSL